MAFFPGMVTGVNLLQRFPLALFTALFMGIMTWLVVRSFLKWHEHQMEPVLEEIEAPKPEIPRRNPLRHSSRRPGNYRPASIKG